MPRIQARPLVLSVLTCTLLPFTSISPAWAQAQLKPVGVLGNTSGLSALPFPYDYYNGIAADAQGRLYLGGPTAGLVVSDQDGHALARLPLPQSLPQTPELAGLRQESLLLSQGNFLYFLAVRQDGARSALLRVDTTPKEASALKVQVVTQGPGIWALSGNPGPGGNLVLGRSDLKTRKYEVVTVDAAGKDTPLFSLDLPEGATRPWSHWLQVEPDGSISLQHQGGRNLTGRYSATGERLGEAKGGVIINGYRYEFGYGGGLRRLNAAGTQPDPGDVGSPGPEIRMARQMVQVGDRYFFAGRGGALEARWTGTHFQYERRLGGIYLSELVTDGNLLRGVAWTSQGSMDVPHPIEIPFNQPSGQLLDAATPLHGRNVVTAVAAPGGMVLVARERKGASIFYNGSSRGYDFKQDAPQVGEVGQAAVLERDMLLADAANGTIWRRPLLDKTAPLTAWRTNLPGVTALAVSGKKVFAATATQVFQLTPDGQGITWTSGVAFNGIHRMAATPDKLYVLDAAAGVVSQLSPQDGSLRATLGQPGQPGSGPNQLRSPMALAADLNGVYVADNGNGRVLVATDTLWTPRIVELPRRLEGPAVAARINVKAPAGGRLSLNVYDGNNLTVRQLVSGADSAKPVTWDGRDMYGKWAKPGTYKYHALLAPKLGLKYVTGISQSGNPPYNTPDGKGSWGGVWGNVMDVCRVSEAPDSDIVVLWAFEEGQGGLIRMSQNGEVRWKQHLDWWMGAHQMAVTCDGTFIYIAGASTLNGPDKESRRGKLRSPLLWRVDAATGAKKLYHKDQDKQPMFGTYSEARNVVTDLAVRDGKLYLTAAAQDKIFVIDPATGAEQAAWSLPGASGVTFTANGSLLAGTSDGIVELDGTGKVKRTFAKTGAPVWDVDTLPTGGVAATVGAPRHQVVFYDANGRETRALGQTGGRPNAGVMQPQNFLRPAGLTVMGHGTVFVAEDSAPRRFTRWSAQGQLEKEFHGPYYLSGMFAVDDADPQYIYGDTHGDIIRYKVDYATGEWKVDRYWLNVYKDTDVPAKWWARIRHHEGKTYWCSGSGGIVELRPDSARAVAAVYGGWVAPAPEGGYVQQNKNSGFKGTWSDLDGDGKKSAAEWQVTANPAYPLTANGPQQGWGAYFDETFNLYMHDWSDAAHGGVWMLPVTWKNGTPTYNWETARQVGASRQGLKHGAAGARTAFAAEGAVYGFNGGYNAAGLPGVGHGRDYEFAQITRYDPASGKPVWHAGERSSGYISPGQHYCPTGAAGVIDDYLFWTDENSLVHVWDKERGLYVDTLLEDISRGPVPTPYTIWVELFNTRVFRHPGNGKVYLVGASDAIHIYEVTGLGQKPVRMEGTFQLTQAGLDEARALVESAEAGGKPTLRIAPAPRPVTLDGDLAEFAGAAPVELQLNATSNATVRFRYDKNNLYAAFDVRDDSPWKNSGTDLTTLFKTGDTLDIWAGPSAASRPVGTGDVRVLLSPMGGKNVAVVYRPKATENRKPVNFRSPSGQVVMDRVDEVDSVKMAVKPSTTGYTLEAAIPLAVLGLEDLASLVDGTGVGFDVSVNWSDPSGTRNVARLHWGRNGAANVYDLPTEAALEPATWGIAQFVSR